MLDTLVEITIWLYDGKRREVLGSEVAESYVKEIARKIEYIQSGGDKKAWKALLTCPELLGDVMHVVASKSQAVQHVNG